MDLPLNNLQRLICHKIQTNKPNNSSSSFNISHWHIIVNDCRFVANLPSLRINHKTTITTIKKTKTPPPKKKPKKYKTKQKTGKISGPNHPDH